MPTAWFYQIFFYLIPKTIDTAYKKLRKISLVTEDFHSQNLWIWELMNILTMKEIDK